MFGSEYIRRKFLNAVQSVNQNVSTLYDWLKQLAYFFTTVVTIFWLSVFFYGTLYYYYVPVVSREKPVYFRFSVCDNGIGMCTFPEANVTLIKDGFDDVFKRGQPYKILLDVDVPESPANKGLGMFMTEIRMYNRKGETLQISRRAANLNYRSELLLVLETFFFSPLYVFGYMQQKQLLSIELFPNYLDDVYNQAVGAVVEIQSLKVEIYTAMLRVFAQFSGLRYFLYYWPVTAAVVGISINFFLLSLLVSLSWLQIMPKFGMESLKISKEQRKTHVKKPKELESEPLQAKTVGPSHSDSDEDSAPDQDDGELLRPAVTVTEEFGIRQRPSTSKETSE